MKEKTQPPQKPKLQPINPDDLVRIAPDDSERHYPLDPSSDLSLPQNNNQRPVGTSHEEEHDD